MTGSHQTVACRGIRGAITVSGDPSDVAAATVELLAAMLEANDAAREDVAAATFTLTEDLAGAQPAAAAREAGWDHVPLLMVREHDTSLARCIRVLLLVNTTRTQAQIVPVYLRDAVRLRTDLTAAR